MAFVSESIRNTSYLPNSQTGDIGPGEYHLEGEIHKQAMAMVYPKKQVPFNTQLKRQLGNYGSSSKYHHHIFSSRYFLDANSFTFF